MSMMGKPMLVSQALKDRICRVKYGKERYIKGGATHVTKDKP
jgi:hypothetical protein